MNILLQLFLRFVPQNKAHLKVEMSLKTFKCMLQKGLYKEGKVNKKRRSKLIINFKRETVSSVRNWYSI